MHSLLEANSDAICCLWEVWQVYVAQASLEVALDAVMHTLNVAIGLRFTYLHAGIASFPGPKRRRKGVVAAPHACG